MLPVVSRTMARSRFFGNWACTPGKVISQRGEPAVTVSDDGAGTVRRTDVAMRAWSAGS